MTVENEKQNQNQNQNQDNPNPDQSANNGTTGNAPGKGEKTVPYERFQKVNDAKKQAEETLAALVAELVEDIPEQFRALVPNIAPADQIKWIRSANKSGLFSAKPEPSGPDSKRPGGKPATDTSGMSPLQMIEMGLKA